MAEDGSVVIKISGDDSRFRKTLGSLAKVSTAAIAGAGSALAGLGAYAVKVGSEFEASMSQVAATMGMTTEEIHNGSEAYETLATAAKNAGATTKFTATQAADALNYLALAGYDAATSAEVLPSVLNLAAAGGLDLAYASDLATDAMAALGIEASADNLTQFGDQMAMASSKANYSVAQLGEAILTVGGTAKNLAGGTVELNAALGVLANRGVKGAEGGTALRNMILSLSAPTDTAVATLKSLGVSAFDAEGNLRPLNETFKDLDTAMQSLTQEQKTNVLNDIFNKVDLKSAEAMLAGCGEEFDNLADAIANSDGAMQNMADVQMDNLKGQITLLQSAVEGLGVALYENIDGTIKDAVSAAAGYVSELNAVMGVAFADAENTENVEKVTKALMELGYSAEEANKLVGTGMSGVVSSLGGILAQALADVANAAPALLDAGIQLIAAFLQGIQENSGSLAEGALSIIGTLGEGIAELLPMVADTAADLVVSLADGLKENLPKMIPVAIETISTLVENLTENANTIIEAGIEIILALGEGLIAALPQLIETVLQIVINIANVINDNAPKLVDTALYLITRLAVGLVKAIPTLVMNIPKIIEAIVAAFMAFQWLNLGKQLIDGVANGVKKAGESMATAAKNAFSKFKSKLTGSEVATELKNIGKYIIDGIIGGIKNGFAKVGQVASQLKDTLLSKLKGAFKIASPSKLMKEEVGEYIGEGIAVGIEESGQQAVDAAETVADKISDTLTQKRDSLQSKLADYGDLFQFEETDSAKVLKLTDLQDDIDTLNQYKDALLQIKAVGVSEGLMDEIVAMNPEDALQYMEKLLSMTESDLDEYISLYEEKQRAAKEIAREFYGTGAEVAESVNTISTDAVSAGMEEQQSVVAESAKQMTEAAKEEIAGFETDFRTIGENLMEGVAQGVRDGQSGVVNAVAKALRAAARAAKEEMDIHSPSRVMAEIGDYMAQGVGVGWSDRMDSVTDTISDSLSDGFSQKMTSAYEKMRAAMSQNMVRLRGDIAVQRGGDTSYITKTVNNTEGNTVLQIEHFHNDSKEAVPSLMQEMEFSRRQRAMAKGGA